MGEVNLKLLAPRDMLVQKHNRACFRKPYGSEHVIESQKLLKFEEKYFYFTFSSFLAKLNSKKLFLITSELLGLLDNTSTGNY